MVPNATYLNGHCYGSSGPKTIAYYPYHEIFISLLITDAGYLELTFHVPPGVRVTLNDQAVRVEGHTRVGAMALHLKFRAGPGAMSNSGPPSIFRALAAKYTGPDDLGPLEGGTEQGTLRWFQYGTHDPIPLDVASGTLILPSISINGHSYDGQSVSFTQDSAFTVKPINC